MKWLSVIVVLVVGACEISQAQKLSLETVTIGKEGNQVAIGFQSKLQWANSVFGPWQFITNVPGPLRQPTDAGQRYYRSYQPESVYSSTSVVQLTITGPFQTYFEKAFAGTPDGIIPPKREKPYFDGSITINGYGTFPVNLRVRGNSSLQECPFPKMKFKVGGAVRDFTPFFDAREIKVGTHCAEGGRGPVGRLREERAIYRETVAYEVMNLLGFITPKVRRAQIEYHDTTPTNGTSEVGWILSRQAMVLEDAEVIAARLGGKALDDTQKAALTNANFGQQFVAEVKIFHALLGNWDFTLSEDGRETWNADVISMPNGRYELILGDFDLSSWVTENVRLSAPRDYHPEMPDLDRQVLYTLETLLREVGNEVYTAAKVRFEGKRSAIEALVNNAQVDPIGKTNALEHIRAFYEALATVGIKR